MTLVLHLTFSMYTKPDGKGRRLCMKDEDYIKYGWDESKGWFEDAPLVIFPDCLRVNLTQEKEDVKISSEMDDDQ